MIVAEGDDGGIVKQRLTNNDAHIDTYTSDASVADALFVDELEVLVEQQNPRFFHVKILHLGMHHAVNGLGRVDLRTFFCFFQLPTLAQFAGSKHGDGFGRPHTSVFRQFADSHLPQCIQVVLAVVQDVLHQVDSTLLR